MMLKRASQLMTKSSTLLGALRVWEHYLVGKEFVLYSDCGALKHLNNHTRISKAMHAR